MSKEIQKLFPADMRPIFVQVDKISKKVQEIRLRINSPIMIKVSKVEYYIDNNGNLTKEIEKGIVLSEKQIDSIVNHICDYSPYAFARELRQGYITVEGGHRIGIAGKIVMDEEKIECVKNIRFLNIRISHEILDVAKPILDYVYKEGGVLNTLIISPPGFGKTTLLRDMIRQVSNGNQYGRGVNVAVVDERSEIGGSFLGVPQNDLGIRTDVLDGCTKEKGMIMLIRSMAPTVVAVDELGTTEDIEALKKVVHCGTKVFATIHGDSYKEVTDKPFMEEIIREKYFRRYIVIKKRENNYAYEVLDEGGKLCFESWESY